MNRLTLQTPMALAGFLFCTSCGQDYQFALENPNVHPGDITECGFTQVEETAFFAYDCNPVFETTGEAWAETIDSTAFLVTEVMGHPFYQLWYTGGPSSVEYGDFGLGYAISAEGTEWDSHTANPLLEEPGGSAWDGSAMDGMQVVWDPISLQYVMLYQGYNLDAFPSTWGLGVATSIDGRDWSRLPLNPVVDFTASSGGDPNWCWPLGLTLGEVAGFTGYVAGSEGTTDKCEVFPINASDVTNWTPGANKIYSAGPNGAFDDEGVASLAIAQLDGIYYMFYVGFADWEDHITYRTTVDHQLGVATSLDGRNWTRGFIPEAQIDGTPTSAGPLNLRPVTTGYISAVAAHRVDDRIHLWITDEWDGVQAVGYFLFDPNHTSEGEE